MAMKKEPLYIGCTLDLTKGAAPLGRRLLEGITLRVNEINQAGGINGRTVQVVFMDDGYSPAQARENVESFMKNYKSSLFLSNLGSPTTERYIDLMKDQKIFVFFPSTGAPLFRQPSMKGVVHWRASFPAEGKALTQFVKQHYGVSSFAFLYQNDSFGQGALEGARQLEPKGTAVGYERNVTSFNQQIGKIKEAAVEAIGFLSTSAAAIEFIRQAGVGFFIGKKLFGLSDLAEESFKKFAASRGLDFTISQFVPNPETSKLTIAQKFRELLRKQGGTAGDVFMFEGYISASLAFFILEQAQEYTPEAINKVLETIRKEDYQGLTLSFVSDTRELAHLLWIDTGDSNWISQEIA
jgi:ABC-type branched-subunit amino acid transport system substrate-binding protein